jgi:Mrp family chromosome partitioning ATPase
VVKAAKLDWSPGDFLAHSSIRSDPQVDLLTFRVSDKDPRFAAPITSPFAARKKSTTAANLAIATTGAGRRVVLLDLDLRRPRLEALFRLPPRPEVSDVLLEKARLEDAIVEIPVAYGGRGRPSVTFDERGIDSLDDSARSGSPEPSR